MISEQIAAFASNTEFDALPDQAVARAKLCFYDWLVVANLGSKEPHASAFERAVLQDEVKSGSATILGRRLKTSPFNAAFLNGVNSHVLDYDDMHVAMNGHPGVAVFPALLAAAEATRASGRSVITGFTIGAEIACRFGLALSPSHYDRGWHATSTAGVLGAALAVSKIIGLDVPQMMRALSFAATQASGLQRVFGTMGKPLNAGHASACGLLSAYLAKEGATAPLDVFSGHQGYLDIFAETASPTAITNGLGDKYFMEDIIIKRYPSCFSTHAPIDAALALRSRLKPQPEGIQAIEVHVSQMAINVAGIPSARTMQEGKFSTAYCVAAALVTGNLALPEGLEDLTIQSLAARTRLIADKAIRHDERKATVILRLTNGTEESASADILARTSSFADDWAGITQKAVGGLRAPDQDVAPQLSDTIRRLEEVENVGDIVRALG